MAIQRGEIYVVNLNPVQGREQAGHRPVFVLSIDVINQLPLVVSGVVGTKGENITRDYPTQVGHSLGSTPGKRYAPSVHSAFGSWQYFLLNSSLPGADKTGRSFPSMARQRSADASAS